MIAHGKHQGSGAAGAVPGGQSPTRLASYQSRTQTPLDLLSLATLWIVVVPPGDFGTGHHVRAVALAVRLVVSVVFALDMAVRSILAPRHLRYAITHPLGVVSILAPPVRVLFSLRLLGSMFRRGRLPRFLLAEAMLILNGAVIEFLYERHAAGSNIHSLGDSLWWVVVTVTTVGYGDFYPVTVQGRIVAGLVMATGLLTLAVVTAQVASSFATQAAGAAAPPATGAGAPPALSLEDLDRRLARIEVALGALCLNPGAPDAPGEPSGGGS